jgi:hypothetical protein
VKLSRLPMAELLDVIRRDPVWRTEAWWELKFRNQARQAFEGENRRRASLSAPLWPPAIAWVPPDLSPPEPPREGPLTT